MNYIQKLHQLLDRKTKRHLFLLVAFSIFVSGFFYFFCQLWKQSVLIVDQLLRVILLKNEVMRFFDYEVYGELKNANYLHKNSFLWIISKRI